MTHIHNHALPLPGKDDEKYIQPMADIFKVLSDPTRIRILSLLAHEEMCVTCIADALGMTHSAISHQLRLLRATYLVSVNGEVRFKGKKIGAFTAPISIIKPYALHGPVLGQKD